MKKYKAQCATHNKNILFIADNNPMCSQCDYESYWVLQSFQADQEFKYSKSQQKSNIIKLLASYKRKLSALLKTFDLIKNQYIDKLDKHLELYLNQNYKIDLMIENIQQIDNLQTMLDKQLEYNNNHQPKIAIIIFPKANKLISLNKDSTEQRRPQEKMQMENQTLAIDEIQNQEEIAQPEGDYEDVEQRFIQIPTRNIYLDEQYFYQKANASLFGCPIFDELISKKLDINIAPKQLRDLDREHNLYEVFTDDKIMIFGYSQNYLLNGRAIILHENYIENGYFIKGVLVWGQIFSLMTANNIIYEEIDNTELLDAIDLYENQSILWNRWHYIRITDQQ